VIFSVYYFLTVLVSFLLHC